MDSQGRAQRRISRKGSGIDGKFSAIGISNRETVLPVLVARLGAINVINADTGITSDTILLLGELKKESNKSAAAKQEGCRIVTAKMFAAMFSISQEKNIPEKKKGVEDDADDDMDRKPKAQKL